MRGKIILEEHVCLPDQDLVPGLSRASRNGSDLFQALLDLHGERLQEMNTNGVEYAIISQSPAGPQGIHTRVEAEKFAVKSNNYIAELVGRAPERFGAFACLSMHDPEVAVHELVRCVETLGMLGAMLHGGQEFIGNDGQIDEFYYDEPRYDPFWAKVEELDVPIYLHPKNPLPRDMRLFKTRPWLLGPTYSFARDASFQALALFTSGLFDKYPRVKIILGHMGEMILNHLHRMDHWLEKRNRGRNLPSQKTLREYFEQNIFVTTAGDFSTPALIHAITEIGVGRVLFSVDTPYENITEGATWLDTLPISHTDIAKIGRNNALELFPKLKQGVLRTSETENLQTDRQRCLFTTNPGFE